MILSRILLNPAYRDVWRWLREPKVMHGVLWTVFPGVPRAPDARASIALLYRAEQDARSGHLLVYVQADAVPRWELFPADALLDRPWTRSVKEVHASVETGDAFAFRLRACPRREAGSGQSKHVPVAERTRTQRVVQGPEALAWLARQGVRHGFRIEGVQGIDEHSERGRLFLMGTRFDGRLHVTDAAAFRAALRAGVGPQKAYGYGLVTIARPR
jgi:CRISPR system Cascade subunit CasE